MTDKPITPTTDRIIATDVSAEQYMAQYAADFCEWVSGAVIEMSPVRRDHTHLTTYLLHLLGAYLELRPIGTVMAAPFVMRLRDDGPYREPDVQVILHDNPHALTDTAMNGPADIVIEVVSPESVERDHGIKFKEYETAGVPEYWIIDPLRQEARLYRRDDDGIYIPQSVDANGDYRTPTLPGFRLHVPTLWAQKLPGPIAAGEMVKAMLGDADDD